MSAENLGQAHSLLPKKVKAPADDEFIGELAASAQLCRNALASLPENAPSRRTLEVKASLRERLVTDKGHCFFRREVNGDFPDLSNFEREKVDLDILALECYCETGQWPIIDSDLIEQPASVDFAHRQ